MPEEVSYNTIEQKVVDNWCRLVKETAEDKGDNLSTVQPFFPFEQTYSEIME